MIDYSAALKTVLTLVLTLVGFALLFALIEEFPVVVAIIMGAAMIFAIVAVIYLGFKGDLPDL